MDNKKIKTKLSGLHEQGRPDDTEVSVHIQQELPGLNQQSLCTAVTQDTEQRERTEIMT